MVYLRTLRPKNVLINKIIYLTCSIMRLLTAKESIASIIRFCFEKNKSNNTVLSEAQRE